MKRNNNMSKKKASKEWKNRSKICSGDREMNAPGIAWFENKVTVATSISVGGTMTINVMIVEKKQNNILSADQLGDLKTA